MQFLQAKSGNNKLHAYDNLPYAIDNIFIQEDSILINLIDYAGIRLDVRYKDITELKKEFNIINSIREIRKYKEYDY